MHTKVLLLTKQEVRGQERTVAKRTCVVEQTDHTQLMATPESKLWLSFEQRWLRGIMAKFSDGKYFLSSLKN